MPLYSFGGKPITVQNVKPYYTAKDTIKVDVFVYTNVGADTNFNYLGLTIADSIANQLEYNKSLVLKSSNDIELTPHDFEKVYNYKVFQFTNITYTFTNSTNMDNMSSTNQTTIVTNYEYTYYTNWGTVRSNVRYIKPGDKRFFLDEGEVVLDYNGSNVLVKNTNGFTQSISLGDVYYQYNGENIKEYVFENGNSDISVYGTIEYKRPNIHINTYVAYIKDRKIHSYSVEIPESQIDDYIPIYALEIANKISLLDTTGVVAINVEPKESFVYIDDVLIGVANDTLYIPALTTNSHRFTIKKDDYETIDTMLEFENSKEDIVLSFQLNQITNKAKVLINIPEDSTVLINGVKEVANPNIDRYFGFGSYSIKITNQNYMDYYGTFQVDSTNSQILTPTLMEYKEPTLFDKIFKNYERNTKIGLGLTIASGIFAIGSYVYANEVFDSTLVKYYDQYQNDPNRPAIDLTQYNTAFNLYVSGLVLTGIFAVTTSIYYMLWINEDNFNVEKLSFNWDYTGVNLMYSYSW